MLLISRNVRSGVFFSQAYLLGKKNSDDRRQLIPRAQRLVCIEIAGMLGTAGCSLTQALLYNASRWMIPPRNTSYG